MVVVKGDWWKLGQARPGDTLKFVRVELEQALAIQRANTALIKSIPGHIQSGSWKGCSAPWKLSWEPVEHVDGADVWISRTATAYRPDIAYRAAGDSFMLVEYGSGAADLNHKCRSTALKRLLETEPPSVDDGEAHHPILNTVSCGNSLMIHFDGLRLPPSKLIEHLEMLESKISATDAISIENQTFVLPLVFEHRHLTDCLERYMANQRDMASYLPDTLSFVAENNGITVEQLKRTFLELEAVVVGVGFLMALPQCLPKDP